MNGVDRTVALIAFSFFLVCIYYLARKTYLKALTNDHAFSTTDLLVLILKILLRALAQWYIQHTSVPSEVRPCNSRVALTENCHDL